MSLSYQESCYFFGGLQRSYSPYSCSHLYVSFSAARNFSISGPYFLPRLSLVLASVISIFTHLSRCCFFPFTVLTSGIRHRWKTRLNGTHIYSNPSLRILYVHSFWVSSFKWHWYFSGLLSCSANWCCTSARVKTGTGGDILIRYV